MTARITPAVPHRPVAHPPSPEARGDVVARLLEDHTHHIEFRGYLTNHVKHAVVALTGLGASAERIESYYRGYAAQTPYGGTLEAARQATTTIHRADWEALLGRRLDFDAYRRFFAAEERRLGLVAVVEHYAPRLMEGGAGALLHGTIHLGWALDGGSRDMIIEGLAYLAHTWVSTHPEREGTGGGEERVWDSVVGLSRAWHHDGLAAEVEEINAHPTGYPGGFPEELAESGAQLRIARLLDQGVAPLIQTPRWLATEDVDALWEPLHEAATLLYLSHPADFVLLHVVTALYALEQITAHVSWTERRRVLTSGWRALVAVLLTRGLLAPPDALEALYEHHRAARVDEAAWDEVVERARNERDAHNVKLVYLQQRHWRRFGQRALFHHAAERFIHTPQV